MMPNWHRLQSMRERVREKEKIFGHLSDLWRILIYADCRLLLTGISHHTHTRMHSWLCIRMVKFQDRNWFGLVCSLFHCRCNNSIDLLLWRDVISKKILFSLSITLCETCQRGAAISCQFRTEEKSRDCQAQKRKLEKVSGGRIPHSEQIHLHECSVLKLPRSIQYAPMNILPLTKVHHVRHRLAHSAGQHQNMRERKTIWTPLPIPFAQVRAHNTHICVARGCAGILLCIISAPP